MKKEIKVYTEKEVLGSKFNIFNGYSQAINYFNEMDKLLRRINGTTLSPYFEGDREKYAYLKYSDIKNESKNIKEYANWKEIFTVEFGEYPQMLIDDTFEYTLEDEYQKKLSGDFSFMTKVPNYKFDYICPFDVSDTRIEKLEQNKKFLYKKSVENEQAYRDHKIDIDTYERNKEEIDNSRKSNDKQIDELGYWKKKPQKYSLDVYEFKGEKYIRVLTFGEKKDVLWYKIEPVRWIVHKKTGIARNDRPCYMPFGVNDFVKNIQHSSEKTITEDDKIQQVLSEIKEYLNDYYERDRVYSYINNLFENYNEQLLQLKENQNNKIFLSLEDEKTLYNKLYLKLSNILDKLRPYIIKLREYIKFSETLKSNDAKNQITDKIASVKEQLVKDYKYPPLIKKYDEFAIEKYERFKASINNKICYSDYNDQIPTLDDTIKKYENIIESFLKNVIEHKDYYDFINVLRLENKDDELYDELNMIKNNILPQLHNADLSNSFEGILYRHKKNVYESIPDESSEGKKLKELKEDFRKELFDFLLKVKVEISKKENDIDNFKDISSQKKDESIKSICDTNVEEIENLISSIEEKIKKYPFNIYEDKNGEEIDVKENFQGIKNFFESNKEILKNNEVKLKILLFNLGKIDAFIEHNINNQQKIDNFIIK